MTALSWNGFMQNSNDGERNSRIVFRCPKSAARSLSILIKNGLEVIDFDLRRVSDYFSEKAEKTP